MRLLLALLALIHLGCSTGPASGGSGPQPPPVAFGPRDPTGEADFLIDFGSLRAGSSASWPIRLRNPGASDAAVQVEGLAPPFSVSGGAFVPAGGSLDLAFRFAPTVLGSRKATARIVTDGATWTVRLAGVGLVDARCDPRLSAETIDFGKVAAGGSAQATLRIDNRGGAPCLVSALPIIGDVFTALGPLQFSIGPGRAEDLPLRAVPNGPGTSSGELVLNDGTQTRRIPLQVEQVESCVSVTGDTDFGEVTPGCSTAQRTLTFTNGCSGELNLASFTLEQGQEFVFVRRPALAPVQAGGSFEVEVAYRPTNIEASREASLTVVADRESPAVRLTARPGKWPIREDHFHQDARPKNDVLFVIDDSPEMAPFAAQLRAWIRWMGDAFEDNAGNLTAAITTTSLAATETCPGSGADGRALPLDGSTPRILDGDTMDLGAALEANLPTAFCSTAPNRGLDAAIRAVTELANTADDPAHVEANDGNLGFRREGAHLQLIFVTARDDASAADPHQLRSLAGVEPTSAHLFAAHALYAAADCAFDPTGTRYDAAVDAVYGLIATGCGDPWPSLLRTGIGTGSFQTRFWLTEEPLDLDGDGRITEAAGEITVLVDDEVIPQLGGDGETSWAHDPEQDSLDFTPGHQPPEGSRITVRYAYACFR